MTVATETPTLRSIVRSLYANGESDIEIVATKATQFALSHEDLEQIIWEAVHEIARQEYRADTRVAELEAARSSLHESTDRPRTSSPTRRLKLDRKGRHIKATSERSDLLRRTIWIPKKGRMAWSEVEVVDLDARADYMTRQLANHADTVNESIAFIGNVTYFMKKTKVRRLADYQDFQWSLIPGFSTEQLERLDGGE